MSVAIVTTSLLARPSSVLSTAMTDAERLAFGTNEIGFCMDAAEQATEYGGLYLRDRAGGRPCRVVGGAMSTLNDRPAIEFSDDDGGRIEVPYQVTASYFAAFAVSLDSTTTTNCFFMSSDDAGDRLQFSILNNGSLYHSHSAGLDAGKFYLWLPGGTLTGPHVFWCSYDAVTGAACVGMDAVTPGMTSTISVPHKGTARTDFFGGVISNREIDGKAALAVVVPRYLGGAAQAATRAAILSYMAECIGVTLAA